jgi:hypothetical protein
MWIACIIVALLLLLIGVSVIALLNAVLIAAYLDAEVDTTFKMDGEPVDWKA